MNIMLYILLFFFVPARADVVTRITETEFYDSVKYPYYMVLNDGNVIPTPAFGTFTPYESIRNSNAIEEAVITAIESGYRHIDTAPMYYTEGDVGRAIKNVTDRGIVCRDELFITTKLDLRVDSTEGVIPALQQSLDRLMLDYVDLYIIHFPETLDGSTDYDILAQWRGLEEAQKIGLTVSIGVSNFNSSHINKILTYGNIRPAVNQIEINPTYTELELAAYCLHQGIAVTALGPHGYMVPRPYANVTLPPQFNDPILVNIASRYGKTTNQVVLRYLIDRGTIPIPQSTNKTHIQENIDLFDFRLTREEIYLINNFNENKAVYPIDDPAAKLGLLNYCYGCNATAFPDLVNCIFENLS